MSAIKNKSESGAKKNLPLKFVSTIEFFPEEGKYHYDGHRLCKVSMSPEETKKVNGICPVCGKPLVIGVLNRVAKLADRKVGVKPACAVPFRNLIPLREIIADAMGVGKGTKSVGKEYFNLMNKLGREFNILIDAPIGDIASASSALIADGVRRVREWKVKVIPGFDGEYGKIKIFDEEERKKRQKSK